MLLSLAASEALLIASALLYGIHLLRHPAVPDFPPVKLPLALYCLTTMLSIGWAENPAVGWTDVRKFVLFLIWLLALNLVVRAEHLLRLLQGLFLVSLAAALLGIAQFVIQYRDVRAYHPAELYRYLTSTRIHGFMGHWMHFGGQQMLVFIFLLAFLLLRNSRNWTIGTRNSERRRRISDLEFQASAFWWATLAIIMISIILNFTRGVWLGCFLAGAYLVFRWKPKALWALPVLAALLYLGAPSLVRERFYKAAHPTRDPSLSIRLEMWGVALKMIRAHPWVGVGPNNIEEVYDLYMPPGKMPELGYHNHFHNDFLQFGAERGLPCLAAWVWLMAALGWYTRKLRRDADLRTVTSQGWVVDASLAAWLAFLAEGCFEFNFGTSPVLMVFLFVTSTPFVAAKIAGGAEEMESAAVRENTCGN
jgi:O-antigen ligase